MNLGDLVIKLSRTLLTVVEVPDPAVDAVPAGLLPHTAGQARRAQVPTPEPGQVEAAAAELGETSGNCQQISPVESTRVAYSNHSPSPAPSRFLHDGADLTAVLDASKTNDRVDE